VELIEIVVELEKELEEFQRTFENDQNFGNTIYCKKIV
jgi:hypothetical protein